MKQSRFTEAQIISILAEQAHRAATADVCRRKGFVGLSAMAETVLRADPYSGHLFVFRGRPPRFFRGFVCRSVGAVSSVILNYPA